MDIGDGVTLIKGENGSGKSTILKAIMNLIHYEGDIDLDLKIQFCPETPIDIPLITCEQLIDVAVTKETYTDDMLFLLFDIKVLLKKRFNSSSKGEQQRVRLFMTLMNEADIFLLDEPFNGLSSMYQTRLKKWLEQTNTPCVVSTHLDYLDDMANRTVYV